MWEFLTTITLLDFILVVGKITINYWALRWVYQQHCRKYFRRG